MFFTIALGGVLAAVGCFLTMDERLFVWHFCFLLSVTEVTRLLFPCLWRLRARFLGKSAKSDGILLKIT